MVALSTEAKAKIIVKTFLAANPGKKFTGSQIAAFMNGNNLGLGKYNVNAAQISRWIKYSNSILLREVKKERKGKKNVWYYWVEET